jgi:hypothetical protein
MRTLIENQKEQKFEIDIYFEQEFKGRGGWNINCEVCFMGAKKTFRRYITDSGFIDEISRMKSDNSSHEEIQNAYKEKVFDSLEESILEWCEDVLDKQEEEELTN